jgi:hypothetical protein
MATRQTRLVIKNNTVPSAPFSGATLLKGEAIVNTADGILMFSGVTSSTSEWTPAGTGGNANFFEVGSNLYDLKIRNKIASYSGVTNLSGKFLSGTTNGFVLADISDIAASVDSHTTGATWNPNILTLKLNNGKPNVSVSINAFTALTVGDLTVTGTTSLSGSSYYYGSVSGSNPNEIVNVGYLTGFSQANDVYVTGNTLTPATNNTATQSAELSYHGSPLGGPHFITTENTFTTGGTYDNNTTLITFDKNDGTNYTVSLSGIDVNDTYVTGGTVAYDAANLNATLTLTRNDNVNITITGLTDVYTTGATLISDTVYFNTNESLSAYTLDLSSIDINDTYVTAYTYTASANTLTIYQNEGEAPLNVTITSMSGLTINGDFNVTGNTYLGPTTATTIDASTIYSGGTNLLSIIDGRDTYVTGFTYNPATNTFTITRNQGEPDLNAQISSVTGLTISTLGSNRVVYTTNSGQLTTEAGFDYNASANTLTVGNINVQNASGTTANIGQGGLVIGSGGSLASPGIGSLTVHGNLTVFGTETIVATSELYVEDPQITLNYNPTGSTIATSVASGIRVQDGNGIASGDTYFTISQMQNLTGLTPTEIPSVSEYTGLTGYANRGWLTQLNDIVIRNNNLNEGSPNGVRVLAEFDTLDGGSY